LPVIERKKESRVAMKVGIVGAGAVGLAIAKLFPDAVLYDEPKKVGARTEINRCDVVFVCVPTPRAEDGSCDTSIVEDVVSWLDVDTIVLRSTVAVGTTRRLAEKYAKSIVFQPEYGPAETPDHPFNDLRNVRWAVLGGDPTATRKVSRLWQSVYSADFVIRQTTPEAAELCKYMENAFLAMKVTFCNEFFEIARRFGIDYDDLRELWLLDPRIGRSHTWVFSDKRGFGGRCLPKDLDAVIAVAEVTGYDAALLREVARSNARIRRLSAPKDN
jgi:UDPglucose 6-dehydrogenase